jgi:hypothetical protein
MTPQQIINKISELEQWLRDNPNHENQYLIQKDLRNLREKQASKTQNHY